MPITDLPDEIFVLIARYLQPVPGICSRYDVPCAELLEELFPADSIPEIVGLAAAAKSVRALAIDPSPARSHSRVRERRSCELLPEPSLPFRAAPSAAAASQTKARPGVEVNAPRLSRSRPLSLSPSPSLFPHPRAQAARPERMNVNRPKCRSNLAPAETAPAATREGAKA